MTQKKQFEGEREGQQIPRWRKRRFSGEPRASEQLKTLGVLATIAGICVCVIGLSKTRAIHTPLSPSSTTVVK